MPKIGVALINLGTPDSPSTKDVRKYLREFLMDGRVIDVPFVQRFLLVQGIIAPFRAPKSAAEYQKLWTEKGSPLLFHGIKITELLQESLGEDYKVVFGMRYQNPSVRSALDQLKDLGLEKIIVIPLYPQYASASTGSTMEHVMKELSRWQTMPAVEVVSQFCEHPRYIESFVQVGQSYMAQKEYDHVVFTYHGLPQRQIRKGSTQGYCQLNEKCCSVYHAKNKYCYRAQCFQTTRLLVEKLDLNQGQYTTCFQSRLGRDPWIKPYTDEIIPELVKKGVKRVLAFSPSFIADCLETTVEIGETYKEQFIQEGGQEWDLVESLNAHPTWIECLKQLVLDNNLSLVK